MFEEKKNLFMDFGCFPRDFRNQASYNDLGFGAFPLPTSSSDGFRFSGDRTSPMTPIMNDNDQFLRNLLNLNTTKACSDLGLCQNLSKMAISDEEDDGRSTIFTGSHPFLVYSGSRNLHGFSRLDRDLSHHDPFLEFSSRRQGSVHSSYGEVSAGGYVGEYFHRLRLLDLQDISNPNPRVRDRDYLFQPMNQQIRPDSRMNHEVLESRDMIFPPFSAMGGSRELRAKCVKKKSLLEEDHFNEEDLPLDLESMVGIYGSVYLMAKDQMGCRLLQKFVERGGFLDSMIIFEEVINHVIELGTDQFGNYFLQKLIQVCNEEQRTQILIMFTSKPGLLVTISLNTYG
ncbi:unnamed protein product [Arabis nemorensis]|uniref:PUM-HD domain-containing protein n=1 Tax=Arabis nemorensis TaxID=586526 RepID=A0A565C4M4_9BRAS|nr:unnamed protein product [Arabis nemorensis]